jgi:hypothetical protein
MMPPPLALYLTGPVLDLQNIDPPNKTFKNRRALI